MPTVHREGGLRFIVFPDDHPPPHVHVDGNGGRGKIDLAGPTLLWVRGLSVSDRKLAVDVVKARREEFLALWKRFHG